MLVCRIELIALGFKERMGSKESRIIFIQSLLELIVLVLKSLDLTLLPTLKICMKNSSNVH